MTGRQRVLRCLEFNHPDRVPRDLWALPISTFEHGVEAMAEFQRRWPVDIGHPGVPNPSAERLVEGDPYAVGQHRDEWGCVFENLHAGIIGQVKHSPLDDWSKLSDLRPPVEILEINIEGINQACAASDRFMIGDCCPRPFERIQFLRGTPEVLMDLARNRPELGELIRIVHDLNCRELEVWGKTDVDGLSFMDDWGSQDNLLISPVRWRQLFKPLYAEYVQIIHDAGKKAFMHSDGYILPIYEDLIEIGVDAINSQLFCMDIEEIGRRWAGRITFWGEIDRQHVLPADDPEVARAAVQRVVESLYRPAGGVIAQFEMSGGSKLRNAEMIFQTWHDLTSGTSTPSA